MTHNSLSALISCCCGFFLLIFIFPFRSSAFCLDLWNCEMEVLLLAKQGFGLFCFAFFRFCVWFKPRKRFRFFSLPPFLVHVVLNVI